MAAPAGSILWFASKIRIDDIEDNSILRRGLPVTHSIYGMAGTLNTANYIYFIALQKTMELEKPGATRIYTEQLLELHRGQGMEIHWRDTVTCPSEDEYLRMVSRKTGGLFQLVIQLMQLFSDSKADFSPLVINLGIYFQIRDDYANLMSKDYAEKKTYCEDLTEGKFSFPIIYAINSHPDDTQILNIVRQKPKEFEVKRYCVELLEKMGAINYTKAKLVELEQQIFEQIKALGGNPYLIPIIEELRALYSSQPIES